MCLVMFLAISKGICGCWISQILTGTRSLTGTLPCKDENILSELET